MKMESRLWAGGEGLLEPGQGPHHVKAQFQIIRIGLAMSNGGGEGEDGALQRQAVP